MEEDPLAGRIGLVGRGGRDGERGDHRVAVHVGVVDVEARVRRVVGGERESEQTALAAGPDPLADVEERRVHDGAVLDDLDPTRLLDDEQPAGPVTRVDDVDRAVEPGRDRLEPDRELGRVERPRRWGDRRGTVRRARRRGVGPVRGHGRRGARCVAAAGRRSARRPAGRHDEHERGERRSECDRTPTGHAGKGSPAAMVGPGPTQAAEDRRWMRSSSRISRPAARWPAGPTWSSSGSRR